MSASGVHRAPRQKSQNKQSALAHPTVPKPATERPADVLAADQEREQRLRWIAIGASVALAVIAPIARQVWRWLWESRTRARLDREILRELGA